MKPKRLQKLVDQVKGQVMENAVGPMIVANCVAVGSKLPEMLADSLGDLVDQQQIDIVTLRMWQKLCDLHAETFKAATGKELSITIPPPKAIEAVAVRKHPV